MSARNDDAALLAAIQDGLPLVARPFAAVAERAGMTEAQVIGRIGALLGEGSIKRLGIVVHHHALGYRANAMVVWDVDDGAVERAGRRLGAVPYVTLCYRRPRRPPRWPYNLFCMIHGRDRATVLGQIEALARLPELAGVAHAVLFSVRRFKQRGARYVSPAPAPVSAPARTPAPVNPAARCSP